MHIITTGMHPGRILNSLVEVRCQKWNPRDLWQWEEKGGFFFPQCLTHRGVPEVTVEWTWRSKINISQFCLKYSIFDFESLKIFLIVSGVAALGEKQHCQRSKTCKEEANFAYHG